jgi:hypothetical protein
METFKQFVNKDSLTLDELVEVALNDNKITLSEDDAYLVEMIKDAYKTEALNEAIMTPSLTRPARPVQLSDKNKVPHPTDPIQKRIDQSEKKWKEYNAKAKVIIGAKEKPVSTRLITPGFFYHFKYKSKFYDLGKIDFFERNPLIACVDRTSKIVLGLNFHYLSPTERVAILNKLKQTYGAKWDNPKSQIDFTWEKAKIMFPGKAKRMIKAYLPNRIQECYAVPRQALYTLCQVDTSNFTPEVTKSTVWKNPSDIKGNRFSLEPKKNTNKK